MITWIRHLPTVYLSADGRFEIRVGTSAIDGRRFFFVWDTVQNRAADRSSERQRIKTVTDAKKWCERQAGGRKRRARKLPRRRNDSRMDS